ncbi:hypothetical protein BJY01DRAFT_234513 [Aspergillus pseudoustus]|uniref:Uncharacterized protein n=1 Tax=Aspergillus pseudoustus TaxID=1810923 RepID=A0ABR4K304_9EURO
MPAELGRKTLASKAATLLYLKAYSNIPVPEVFNYYNTSNNNIRIPPASSPKSTQDTCNKAKILFNKIKYLSHSHLLYKQFSLDIPRGPFYSKSIFYNSVISAFLTHAKTLIPKQNKYNTNSRYIQAVDLWNNFITIGCKTKSLTNRLDYIIMASALREIIESLGLTTDNSNLFPLYYPNLSGFTSSIPKFILLAPPGLPQFHNKISQDLYKSFINSFITIIPDSFNKTLAYKYQKLLSNSQDFIHGPLKDLGQYFLAQQYSPHFSYIYHRIKQDNMPVS